MGLGFMGLGLEYHALILLLPDLLLKGSHYEITGVSLFLPGHFKAQFMDPSSCLPPSKTLSPKPIKPKPETLNLKPETLSPKH